MKKNSPHTILQESIEGTEKQGTQELILLQAEVNELRERIMKKPLQLFSIHPNARIGNTNLHPIMFCKGKNPYLHPTCVNFIALETRFRKITFNIFSST